MSEPTVGDGQRADDQEDQDILVKVLGWREERTSSGA
jgi:hypothetical protein